MVFYVRLKSIFSILKIVPQILLFTMFGLFSNNYVSGQNSTIKEENQSIKTYPFSDPNPVPSLGINAKVGAFYPYFIFDGYTNKGVDKNWKVVTLENEFIAKYYNNVDKAKNIEAKTLANQSNSKFSILLRAINLIGF